MSKIRTFLSKLTNPTKKYLDIEIYRVNKIFIECQTGLTIDNNKKTDKWQIKIVEKPLDLDIR